MNEIVVFTDGSFIKKNNQRYAGIGIHFPNNEIQDISEPFLIKKLTSQRAELYAIYVAIKTVTLAMDFRSIRIYTDSEYSIKSLTNWIFKWAKNGWKKADKKPVKNTDILKELYKLVMKYKGKLNFVHVRSHTGKKDPLSMGNSVADKLAVAGSMKLKQLLATKKNTKNIYIKIGKNKKRTKIRL